MASGPQDGEDFLGFDVEMQPPSRVRRALGGQQWIYGRVACGDSLPQAFEPFRLLRLEGLEQETKALDHSAHVQPQA